MRVKELISRQLLAASVSFLICLAFSGCSLRPESSLAKEILGEITNPGGIIVHLGCGDGRLTAALGSESQATVHGLSGKKEDVEAARRYITSQSLYGRVSVEGLDGEKLPYADNLINGVVVQDQGRISDQEILRVLAPGGTAYVQKQDEWVKQVKPWPLSMDEWTHYLHGADNNAVSKDSSIGPPRRLQWKADPLWLRSHETPSGLENVVAGGGRIYYFFDEGPIGIVDTRLPEQWSLVARDAFNGKLLWKKPLPSWGWPEWAGENLEDQDLTVQRGLRTVVPEQNQRRMVAHGDQLLVTLGFDAPLSFLNSATGEEVGKVPGTEGALEVLASDGTAVVFVPSEVPRTWPVRNMSGFVAAVDCRSARILWKKQVEEYQPLQLAMKNGRVCFAGKKDLVYVGLQDGKELWKAEHEERALRTLMLTEGEVFSLGTKFLRVFDAQDGRKLWDRPNRMGGSGDGPDLFLSAGLLWQGVLSTDDKGEIVGKSDNALTIGLNPRTGEEVKRIAVNDLRSPEHHHRCYRNKATDRFIMTAMEGIEFVDLDGSSHSQNNFVRGACEYGVMPSNGLIYAPPDQCFCEPGAKLLGFCALAPEAETPFTPIPDEERLSRGPAYGVVESAASAGDGDWPTYRHDAARWGTTRATVDNAMDQSWKVSLGGKLTAPVSSGGTVYVAQLDAHTVHALDGESGAKKWSYRARGRIDSPPTIHKGLVLFGSRDGRVYCLRASDGEEVWQFLAAPVDRRVADDGQLESAWPVHGSVLVKDDVVYFAAGRSSYLDGGIRLYGLDAASGKIMQRGLLEGPYPAAEDSREVGFYIMGANSDLLLSEDNFIYMRQKKLTPALEEIPAPVLSTKGEQDVGLHVFSTAGLLDGSWYNRTFWMYAKRWPGFQLANQAPKSGQLLVVDEDNTYSARVFYRRNTHSPMFFPGKEGYLLFADRNDNEPQIVGDKGAREPVEWLPQSAYSRGPGREYIQLNAEAFGLDKGVGYTRAEKPLWMTWVKVRPRAMVKAGDRLFAAGPPDIFDEKDPLASLEGRNGALLVEVAATGGQQTAETKLSAPPVFDGMIAAQGRLYLSLTDGTLLCMGSGGK